MPTQTYPEPTVADARPRPRRPTARGRLLRAAYWGLVLALVGLNAWWFWRDRPAPEMKAIDAWIRTRRLDDAERALRRRVRASRHDAEALMALARILAKREDYLGCADQLHRVPFWSPSKTDALFLEAESYKAVDRIRGAEAAWKACIADNPLHPVPPNLFRSAARELIGVYVLEGRLDEARRTIWRAYDEAPPADRPGVLVMRMRAELERVSHEEAAATLRRYVAADPDDWEARRALALEEHWNKNDAVADREIAACLKARPSDPVSWRIFLEILYLRGDREGVKAALTRLPPSADGDAEIWKYRGYAREWAGDFQGASRAFAEAVALNPHEGEYLYRLGIVENRLGRPREASEHIKKSRQLRQAYAELRDAYFNYLEASAKAGAGEADLRASVGRLASSCEQLGMKREADAWRKTLPEG